jgi:hypothetical protein
MSAAVEAQMKVAAEAEELTRAERLIDLQRPDDSRRLSLDESLDLINERYSDAMRLLSRL